MGKIVEESSIKKQIIEKVNEKGAKNIKAFNDTLTMLINLQNQREKLSEKIEKLKADFKDTFATSGNISEIESAVELRIGLQADIDKKEKILDELDKSFIPSAKSKLDIAAAGISGIFLGVVNELQNNQQQKINDLANHITQITKNFFLESSNAACEIFHGYEVEYISLSAKQGWTMFNFDLLLCTHRPGFNTFCL